LQIIATIDAINLDQAAIVQLVPENFGLRLLDFRPHRETLAMQDRNSTVEAAKIIH
jgi:hypothetical protein